MARRPTQATLIEARAECQRCSFSAKGNNAQALAAQHFDNKGHRVHVTTTMQIVYGVHSGKTRGDTNQGALL
jgi:hypothetical protein